ncbi:MAG: DUF1887 family CARF protein [Kiritimatiellia bacterium]
MKELAFDIVLHLAGEQILPNYMAIRLCECPQHIIVTTEQTYSQVDRLKKELGPSFSIIPVVVPAYKYIDILHSFREATSRTQGRRVGFNITGGTKPMAVAALDFCRETDVTPFYIDTKKKKIHLFKAPFAELQMPPVFNSIEEFCRLAGYSVSNPGLAESDGSIYRRLELTQTLWANKNRVCKHNKTFSEAASRKAQEKPTPPSDFIQAINSLLSQSSKLELLWNVHFPPTADWRSAAYYLAGRWFEEYCFAQLTQLRLCGTFRDLRFGFKAGWEQISSAITPFDEAQDFDIAFTDGYDLTILECKSGNLKQEYVQKLENLRTVFGGAFGKTILISIFPPSNLSVSNRIVTSKGVMLISSGECERLASHVMSVKPGKSLISKLHRPSQRERLI